MLGEVRWGEVRWGEVRWGEVRVGYIMLCEIRLGEVRWDKVRFIDPTCNNTIAWMLFSRVAKPKHLEGKVTVVDPTSNKITEWTPLSRGEGSGAEPNCKGREHSGGEDAARTQQRVREDSDAEPNWTVKEHRGCRGRGKDAASRRRGVAKPNWKVCEYSGGEDAARTRQGHSEEAGRCRLLNPTERCANTVTARQMLFDVALSMWGLNCQMQSLGAHTQLQQCKYFLMPLFGCKDSVAKPKCYVPKDSRGKANAFWCRSLAVWTRWPNANLRCPYT